MKINQITLGAVALLTLSLMGGCLGIPNFNDDGSSKSSKNSKHVTANAVGSSIAPLFASLGNNGAALKRSHNSDDQESTYPLCALDGEAGDGVTFSSDIPSGHYGLKDNGLDVESDTSCDATSLIYWKLKDVTGEDCAGDEMTIASGSGIAAFGTDTGGSEVLIILGTFKVDGQEVACNVFITSSTVEAECEMDGKALETDSCPSTDDSSADDSTNDSGSDTSDSDSNGSW